MIRKLKILIVSAIIFCPSLLFWGCDKTATVVITDEERVQEAKDVLYNKYAVKRIYSDMNLLDYVEIEDERVYVDWSSSNSSYLNAKTGEVHRNLYDHYCTLTAKLTYKEETDSISFDYTLPARKYQNKNPNFSTSSSQQLQFSLAYMAYETDDSYNLTVKVYVFNNLKTQKTLYAIKKVTFVIKYAGKYILEDYVYTNSNQKQFTCAYHDYVIIELPVIRGAVLSSKPELAKITTPDFWWGGEISYTCAA